MPFSLSALRQSKTVRTIAVFASGNMLAMLLGLMGSLVQARYIGPEDMGVLRTFGIVAGYLTFLHLGVFDGLQREIPLQLGRGNVAKAEQAASACLVWILFVSLVSGGVFIGLAIRAACHRELMQFCGWLAYMPMIVGTFYGSFLGTTFRTGQQFLALSKISVIQATIGTLALPLLPLMGYYGACLRMAVSSVSNMFLLHRQRPMRVHPSFDRPSFFAVIRIGLPLSGIGYLATSLWISVEGTLVLTWFGAKALGIYSVAVFVRTIIGQLIQNVNQVLSVKICERYGRSNCAREALRSFVKPVALVSLVSLTVVAIGWQLLPWGVKTLIPRYVEATFLMQIFLVMMPVTLLKIPTAILWVAVKLVATFISVFFGFATFVATAYYFYRKDFGLPGVALAFVLGQLVWLLIAWMFTVRLISQEKENAIQPEATVLFGESGI